MEFCNLKIKEIEFIIKYTPDQMMFASKNRTNHIIGIQLSGNATHYFSNRQLVLSENCLFFLNQKEDYQVLVNEIGMAFSIHFTTYEPIETESFCAKIANTDEFLRMLELIEKEFLSHQNELKLLSDFYSFCSYLNATYQKNVFTKNTKLDEAKSYISSHFREKYCLEYAARSCNLSRRRFNELFKLHFDITPNRFLIDQKIDFARKMLRTEPVSISQTAACCGFSDIYYFSKLFKKETGMTPSEYHARYFITVTS